MNQPHPSRLRWTALAIGLLAGGAQAYDCSAIPDWSASSVYTGAMKARQNGQAYQAKWWTQNNSPAANSGQWEVWTPLGSCDGTGGGQDLTPPTVPAGLAAGNATSSSLVLGWSAATDAGSGIAGYQLLRDGVVVASTTATGHTDTGLAPDTAYRYQVRALDKAGNASALSAAVAARTAREDTGGGTGNKMMVGYFSQWGIYDRAYYVKNIETSGSAALLTHLNYAFGNVRNNRCETGVTQLSNPDTGEGGDATADYAKSFDASQSLDGVADTWNQPLRGNWGQLKKLKARYPKLKVLISLGGWTYSRGFSSAARPENRVAFVKSCIDAYIQGDMPVVENAGGPGVVAGLFDGIDLDWEYPVTCGLSCGVPEDKANFTALLAEFRKQLNAVRPGLLLTIAAPAGVDKVRQIEVDKIHASLDYINVMTYDFHGTWDSITNFHSPLYGASADPSTGDIRSYNTAQSIQAFLDRGVPAAKLNMGIGFYGRGWTNVPNINNGLYQGGTPAPARYEAGNEDYRILKTLTGYTSHVDPQSRAQWIFNGSTFWSFDTPVQITEKMAYLKSKGLGGAFIWDLSGDDAQGTLIKAMGNGLK